MKYIIGAYATAPSGVVWDEHLETAYYQQLKAVTNVTGIEHPFVGRLHPFDDDWFLANVDPNWQFVFTSIPGVMNNLGKDATFGIASTNEQGRQAALRFYQDARQAVVKLNKYLNKKAVSFVKIHTAPKCTSVNDSSKEALEHSLATMQSWDWDGAKLVIEHCDAFIPGQQPEKGFLSIDDEISAIIRTNNQYDSDIGISINWGRSAIETRSVQGPTDHIEKAYKAKLLKGIIFSGATDTETPYGIWKDSHMPPEQALNIPYFGKHSLLTATEIERSLTACNVNDLDFIGGKIAVQPNDITVNQRVAYNQGLLTLIEKSIINTS